MGDSDYRIFFEKLIRVKYSLHTRGAQLRNQNSGKGKHVLQFDCRANPWFFAGNKSVPPGYAFEVILTLKIRDEYFRDWRINLKSDRSGWTLETSSGYGHYLPGTSEDAYYETYWSLPDRNPANDDELLIEIDAALSEVMAHIEGSDFSVLIPSK